MIRGLLALLGWLGKLLLGWWAGKRKDAQIAQETQRAATAEAKDAQAEQIIHAQEVRREVDAEVENLPEAPPQRVGDADPATAAGVLRDKWSRPE